jgi:4-hydroxy-tetrahydrodipicolinate synthase
MGEFWALSVDERERVHELVASAVRGRVPVMAQVGHHAFPDTVRLCEHALASGVDFGIAMNPYYPPSPPPELVRAWYQALAAASTLPMFLFNTMYAGYTLSPELIAELADLDNVCGIKNPQAMEHLLRVQELAGDRIVVTDASERIWLELHTEHGFQALMSTPALALYQRPGDLPIVEYTRLADSGDIDAARALSRRLDPARRVRPVDALAVARAKADPDRTAEGMARPARPAAGAGAAAPRAAVARRGGRASA